MSIRPIVFNGMLQRTEDIGLIKHQEDRKPTVDQQNIQVQLHQKTEEAQHQVVQSSASETMNNHADARDEGKNKYMMSSKKKKQKEESGKVIKKNESRGFDMKI